MNAFEAADYLAERGLTRSARWVRANVPGRVTGTERLRRFWLAADLDGYLDAIRERPARRAAPAEPTEPTRRAASPPRRRERTEAEIKADLRAAMEGR
jgi:hypothetical protein